MKEYRTYVFDCDGVLLDSNRIKSDAFYWVAKPYGLLAAMQLMAFHATAGSITRRARIEHLFAGILKRPPADGEVDRLLEQCDRYVRQHILHCETLPGVAEYLRRIEGRKIVASGVEAGELRDVLAAHGLLDCFDAVWGGPVPKDKLLCGLVESGGIELPAVYFGDTQHDYEAATAAGLDFVMVYAATEWRGWRVWLRKQGKPPVRLVYDFTELTSCAPRA